MPPIAPNQSFAGPALDGRIGQAVTVKVAGKINAEKYNSRS